MNKKILIIEDEKDLRYFLGYSLKQNGYDVIEAFDAEEGMEKAKKEKPDLILLDIILPGINGFDFLSKIKQDQNLKDIPVIILSNLGQKEEIKEGLDRGAVDFLIKANFTLKEIVEKINNFLKP